MKTKTPPIGLTMALLFGTALTLPINVAAEIQPIDDDPSATATPKATLLLPYFEVDLKQKGGDKAASPKSKPSPKKGKKHRNKNSEQATDKTNPAPTNTDNILWGDYFQVPPNPSPKDTKSSQVSKNSEGSGNDEQKKKDGHKHQQKTKAAEQGAPSPSSKATSTAEQWKKTADDAQGRYSVGFDAINAPTPERKVYHPGDANDPNRNVNGNDFSPILHGKAKHGPTTSVEADESSSTDRHSQHKKKHHHHRDENKNAEKNNE